MPTYKPVDPTKALRDLRKDFKDLQRDRFGTGKERRDKLTEFILRAHEMRMINMVMHATPILLDEDPKSPKLLIDAYTSQKDVGDRLESISHLESLAGWIDRPDIKKTARTMAEKLGPKWVAEAEIGERRRRLRDLGSWFGREFADDIRDSIDA